MPGEECFCAREEPLWPHDPEVRGSQKENFYTRRKVMYEYYNLYTYEYSIEK
jgi:hypothetical protein